MDNILNLSVNNAIKTNKIDPTICNNDNTTNVIVIKTTKAIVINKSLAIVINTTNAISYFNKYNESE